MEKYKCEICNKKHAVYYSSRGAIPRNVLEIKMNEETDRIEELSDYLHVIDKKYLIVKGQITLETTFSEYPIIHEAWIEIPIKEYISQIEEAKENQTLELFGKIASELPFYQNFVGLDSKWTLDYQGEFAEIKAITDSELKEDQKKPITEERIIQMMELIHHPELYKKKKIFNKPFNLRLYDAVKKAKTEYSEKRKHFLIGISSIKEVLFQLISSEMLSIKSIGGIGLHISNDESNDNFRFVKRRLTKISDDKMISKIKLDGIETYQKHYEFDDEILYEEVKLIIESAFKENKEELEIDINEI